MSVVYSIEQQIVFERLAGFVSLRGWKDFEVSLDSDELRIERHGRRVACTVIMLPHKPAFEAHFTPATTIATATSFTVGEKGATKIPAPAIEFADVRVAANWLLDSLETLYEWTRQRTA